MTDENFLNRVSRALDELEAYRNENTLDRGGRISIDATRRALKERQQ